MTEILSIPNDLFFDTADEFLAEGKSVRIRAMGYSMQPTFIHAKDGVELSPFDAVTLKRGDVVLFVRQSDKHICLHRIVRRDGDTLYIRGDHNLGAFEVAPVSAVKAIVTSGTMFCGRQFTLESRMWRIQTWIVLHTYPFRFCYLKLRHLAAKIYHKIFR